MRTAQRMIEIFMTGRLRIIQDWHSTKKVLEMWSEKIFMFFSATHFWWQFPHSKNYPESWWRWTFAIDYNWTISVMPGKCSTSIKGYYVLFLFATMKTSARLTPSCFHFRLPKTPMVLANYTPHNTKSVRELLDENDQRQQLDAMNFYIKLNRIIQLI